MNKFSSIFGQILKIFSRSEFETAVKEHKAERAAKGFTCWQQFTAMLFCQLGQAHSLREICGGLASSMGKLKHLGVSAAPNRSTLSYANTHRPWQLYEHIFYQLLNRCQGFQLGHKFRFSNKLFSLDATQMELCASLFDWAKYRQTKGAVKLHLLLDHDGYLPVFAHVTEGNVHEVNIAWNIKLPKGSVVAVDRGYIDYALFDKWTTEGVYFVTRLKDNADYEVIDERKAPLKSNVIRDQLIKFRGYKARQNCPHVLRRIDVADLESRKIIVLLTNHLKFG